MARTPKRADNTNMAKWLRALRLRAGFSQQNVADELQINRSTYTYYEMGKTSPDLATLNRIAKMYKVDLALFMSDSDPGTAMASDSFSRQRAPKKPAVDPKKVGDLTSAEKQVVACIRDNRLDPEDVLEVIQKNYGVK